tara:strand:- start:239 stop:427 length:189 start_codon:yes stop_codon:yes gene_type:complete
MWIHYPINMDEGTQAKFEKNYILQRLRDIREEVRVNVYRETGNTAFDIFIHGINELLEEFEE